MARDIEIYPERQGRPYSEFFRGMEERTVYIKREAIQAHMIKGFEQLVANLREQIEEQEELHFLSGMIIKSILLNLGMGVDLDESSLEDVDWEEVAFLEHRLKHQLGGEDEISIDGLSGVLQSTQIEVSELGIAAYDDVQDYINFFGDRTFLSGGGITDNGNGTATVAAGTAWAKATDSDTAVGKFFNFSADNSVSLTDLITNYVYLDYNGGTPQIVVSTSITTHGFKQDHIHIATIFRNGNTLHSHEEDAIGIGRMNIADMRLLEMHDADRASGLVTTDAISPVLTLNVSAGVIYEGLNRHTTAAQIPASWSTWHYNFGTSAWVETTGQTTIDNLNYNPTKSGTGLDGLTSNRYAVHWLYVDIDGASLFIVYGQDDYTINGAEEAGVPALLPDIAVHYGVLIAKIIVQKSDTTLEILYPWTTTIHSSKSTDHGNLAGLGDDDHAQYTKHSLATAVSDFLAASGSGVFVKKTLAEVKTILGLGTAAYTAATNYVTHALATAANDFLVASGSGAYVKKTLAETLTILGKAAASGLASLNASTKVVEQPASITDHLDGSPDEDDATKAPTSEWAFDHSAASPYTVHGAGEGARVYHSANQTINFGTATASAFDSERYDTDTIHDTVTNNSRLTCVTAGKYVIIGNFSFATSAVVVISGRIRLNGSTSIGLVQHDQGAAASGRVNVACIYDLAEDDYVELMVYHEKPVSAVLQTAANYSPEFMMQRIG